MTKLLSICLLMFLFSCKPAEVKNYYSGKELDSLRAEISKGIKDGTITTKMK